MSENHLVIVRDRIVFREEADFEIQRTEVNKTKSAATDADILNEAFILLFLLMKLYFIFGFVQVIPLKKKHINGGNNTTNNPIEEAAGSQEQGGVVLIHLFDIPGFGIRLAAFILLFQGSLTFLGLASLKFLKVGITNGGNDPTSNAPALSFAQVIQHFEPIQMAKENSLIILVKYNCCAFSF